MVWTVEQSKNWRVEHPDYAKQWNAKNPEKRAAASKKWTTNNPEKVAANRLKNKATINAASKAWQLANPEKRLAAQKKYRDVHREETNAKARQWAKDNPEESAERGKRHRLRPGYEARRRNAMLKKNYGISIEQFEAMAVAQDFKCGVCATDKPGGSGSWHVDHCHKSDVVRKLLCSRCNLALGLVDEDEIVLQKMIDYLRKHKNV